MGLPSRARSRIGLQAYQDRRGTPRFPCVRWRSRGTRCFPNGGLRGARSTRARHRQWAANGWLTPPTPATAFAPRYWKRRSGATGVDPAPRYQPTARAHRRPPRRHQQALAAMCPRAAAIGHHRQPLRLANRCSPRARGGEGGKENVPYPEAGQPSRARGGRPLPGLKIAFTQWPRRRN
jgi:hypothetical protein